MDLAAFSQVESSNCFLTHLQIVSSGNEGQEYGRMRTLEGNNSTPERCSSPASKVSCQWRGKFIEYLMFENLALKRPLYDGANYF